MNISYKMVKRILLAVALIFSLMHSVQGMELLKRHMTKEAMQKTMARLDLAISVGPIWAYALYKNYVDTKNILVLPNASPEVTAFVREEFRRQGFIDWNKVEIKKGSIFYTNRNPFCYAVIVDNDSIKYALQGPSFYQYFLKNGIFAFEITHNSDTFLNATRAILGHEINHLTSYDHMRITSASLITPLITHYSLNKLIRQTQYLPYVLKTPYAFSKLLLSFYLIQTYRRHREWVADESIPHEAALLKANAKIFDIWNQAHMRLSQAHVNSSQTKQLWTHVHKTYFSTHPTFQDRINRMEERVNKVKSP